MTAQLKQSEHWYSLGVYAAKLVLQLFQYLLHFGCGVARHTSLHKCPGVQFVTNHV